MRPTARLGLVVAVAAAAAAVLGARVERARARRAIQDNLDLYADGLKQLEAENEEMREAIPKVWQRGYEAGQHKAEFGLAVSEVEAQQRQRARWN